MHTLGDRGFLLYERIIINGLVNLHFPCLYRLTLILLRPAAWPEKKRGHCAEVGVWVVNGITMSEEEVEFCEALWDCYAPWANCRAGHYRHSLLAACIVFDESVWR